MIESLPRQAHNVCINIDAYDTCLLCLAGATRPQRACAHAKVNNRPRLRRDCAGGYIQHFFVIRNERANAGIVFRKLNAEMAGYAHLFLMFL